MRLRPGDAVVAGAKLSSIEAIRAGTTTFGDYGPGMLMTLPFYEKLGIRASVCTLISEVPPVESLLAEGELYPFDPSIGEMRLMENRELIDKWNGAADGRFSVMIGPQGADGRIIEAIFLLKMRLQLVSEPPERSSGLRLVPVPERGAGLIEHRGEAAMDCGNPADHRIPPSSVRLLRRVLGTLLPHPQ